MPLVDNQKVLVKWISKSRDHYESKGYTFTKWNDLFEVRVTDLSDGASVEVSYICDNENCNNIFNRKYSNIIKSGGYSYCCRKCKNENGIDNIYSNNNLIEEFWRFYVENKKFPLSTDFKNNTSYPCPSTVRKKFGSWDNYLKEIGVVDKNTNDGWYIHDEALIRKYYPYNDIDTIIDKLMIKRDVGAIRQKASNMNIRVQKEIKYKPKYQNEETRKKLIQEAINFYQINNKIPTRKDFSLPRTALEQNWESYNEFLKDCNLPLYTREHGLVTIEDGINFLKDLSFKLKRIPTIQDVDSNGVHKNWFARLFGSYPNALYEAGLVEEHLANKDLKLKLSVDGFEKLYKSLNRAPYYTEYKQFATENELFAPNNFYAKLGLTSYSELCIELVGECNVNDYCIEELRESLIELKSRLGRVPMAKDLHENGLPKYDIYRRIFDVRYFNDILRQLGWKPIGHDPIYKTDEELLNDFNELYLELGRVPTPEEINNSSHMCHCTTYISKFESIFNICNLLDIDYVKNFSFSELSAGALCFDKNRELCRSIPEMIITNFLIDNNIKYLKEVLYQDVIGKGVDKRRFDWYLSLNNICVEYFGFFDEKRKNSDCRVGVYTRKAIKKIMDCQENDIKLICLFPEDKKDDYQGVKEKLAPYTKQLQEV